jgi:hypothetical protein
VEQQFQFTEPQVCRNPQCARGEELEGAEGREERRGEERGTIESRWREMKEISEGRTEEYGR